MVDGRHSCFKSISWLFFRSDFFVIFFIDMVFSRIFRCCGKSPSTRKINNRNSWCLYIYYYSNRNNNKNTLDVCIYDNKNCTDCTKAFYIFQCFGLRAPMCTFNINYSIYVYIYIRSTLYNSIDYIILLWLYTIFNDRQAVCRLQASPLLWDKLACAIKLAAC